MSIIPFACEVAGPLPADVFLHPRCGACHQALAAAINRPDGYGHGSFHYADGTLSATDDIPLPTPAVFSGPGPRYIYRGRPDREGA